MKKSISLLLCLVMLFSVFSVCGAAANVPDANNVMYVKSNGFENGVITYTVYLKKGVTLEGAILKMQYDPAVLKPVMTWSDGGSETTIDDGYIFANNGANVTKDSYGDTVQTVSGEYVSGLVAGRDDMCSVAFISPMTYNTGSSDKAFMSFKFKVVSSAYPETNVNFYCAQFESSNASLNIPKNETSPQLFYTHSTSTLDKTTLTSVYSLENGLRVTWEPTAGATGYKVYKIENGKSILLDGNVPASQTYFDDENVVANEVTRYSVRGFNASGDDSAYPGAISGVYVKSPDKMTATTQSNGVKLTWSAVSGATNYRVYRRIINADGTKTAWVTVATVPSSSVSCVDPASNLASGKNYEYTVRVFTTNGSSAVCRYATVYYYAAPTVKVASVKGGVNVTWNAVDGATSYRIYRKYYGAKSYSQIAVVGGDVRSYIDTAAVSGKGISYTVRAFGSNGSSAYVGKYFNYLQTPKLTGASNSAYGVYIKWNAVGGAANYRVYRKFTTQTKWTCIATTKNAYFTDKTAKSGYNYNYTVIAVNNKIISGFDTAGLYVKYLAVPKLTKVSNLSNGINVKWNSVYGAGSYQVYRKVGNGGWQYIGTVNSTTFTDKNVKKGVYYTYTVRAKYNNVLSYYNTTGLKIKR